ncbi:SigE family RNA polymerase sigma factor [Embleya sp. AB8]|uniref:SigE family RNA polymerase sigma factor n=1 Tax=Embleya sp. AB8 TaxID=3156304 RepID=UPI003C781C2A
MKILNRDEEAEFCAFALTRRAALVRTAILLTGDVGDAEDLAQTVLAKVYVSWHRVVRADNPDAYQRRMLVNTFVSRHRRRRVKEFLAHRTPEPPVPDQTERVVTRSVLIAALTRLPPGRRTAVVLRYWADLSESETAAAMGCTVGTVRSQAYRGLAQLRADPDAAGLMSPELWQHEGTSR